MIFLVKFSPNVADVHPGRFIKHGFIFLGYSPQSKNLKESNRYCANTGIAAVFYRQKNNGGDSLVELVAERGNLIIFIIIME